jgi:Cu+-exporting ATPase
MEAEQAIHSVEKERSGTTENAGTLLTVTGMTCGNCARHVTEALQNVPGVRTATVSLDAHRAEVRWKAVAKPDPSALVEALEQAGYGAKVSAMHTHDTAESKLAGWRLNLWTGVLGTLPLVLGEWVFGLGMEPWFRWISFGLAGIVQIFAGAQFYRGAWSQLKAGSSNMDTLVALGSTTAFGYSLWVLFSGMGGHLYFMESAAIITLISVGHWVESRVSVRASSALRQLLNLAPPTARRLHPDGSETEVPAAQLAIDDLIVVRPGERIPSDAQITQGSSAMDESMLTGESVPVEKTAGSSVYAGTVSLNGRLVARIIATGEQTALAHIVAAVQRAQTSRAHIQRLGDQVSNVFVPIIVLVALSAGLWWGLAPASARHAHEWFAQFLWIAHPPVGWAASFIIASAVLIIACPCAMGLATPAAIMAGSNAAAQRGILIRDGVALEKAGAITTVLFDKTGTLTTGKPTVVKHWDRGTSVRSRSESSTAAPEPDSRKPLEMSELSAVDLAAALARHSNHPFSQAVATLSAREINIPLRNWQELQGAGVLAKLDCPGLPGRAVKLGSLRWLRESGVDVEKDAALLKSYSEDGGSILGLAIETSLQGFFVVKDTLKPGAQRVVEQLRRQGLKIYMVTGDSLAAATNIATKAGIQTENVFAEVRPEQKAGLVNKLQKEGQRVAFVGDGINDAPALEQADLGIAVSRASDVAREAADIILLKSEIEAVPESLGLARATLRTIKQNLFWAFFYNAVGVPLAALGFMSPILCAAAMGLSDLVVIGNALRLRRWRL